MKSKPEHITITQDMIEAAKAVFMARLRIENPESCPPLVDAENILINTIMAPITELKASDIDEGNRKKLVDLTLMFLAPFVGNIKEA